MPHDIYGLFFVAFSISDLCKNRLSEIPTEVCELPSLERLNCYHNVIRAIPVAITQLQALVHLNLR